MKLTYSKESILINCLRKFENNLIKLRRTRRESAKNDKKLGTKLKNQKFENLINQDAFVKPYYGSNSS